MACGLRRCRGKRGCICPKAASPSPIFPGCVVAPPSAPEAGKADAEAGEADAEAAYEDVVKLFQHFDKDGNGKLSREELGQCLQSLDAAYWTLKRIRALFRAADLDRDQFISWKEFLKWIFVDGAEQQAMRNVLATIRVGEAEAESQARAAIAAFIAKPDDEIPSCVQFEATLNSAAAVLGREELMPHWTRLEHAKKPFQLKVATLAGAEVNIQVSRITTIACAKELLAPELGVLQYRLGLSNKDGEVLSDTKTLEEYKICNSSAMMFVLIAASQKFLEMSHDEFVDLVKKRLGRSVRVTKVPTDWDDMVKLREQYIPDLEAIEQREARQKDIQQAVEAEAKELLEIGKAEATAHFQNKVNEADSKCVAQSQKAREIHNDAQLDLDEAMPALEVSMRALDALDERDICEIKSFPKPPPLVAVVGEAVCIMLGIEPGWENFKKLVRKPNLIEMLKCYDKNNISPGILARVESYMARDEFRPEYVSMQSHAASAFCMWVHAMHIYDRVAKRAFPKREALRLAEAALEDAQLEFCLWKMQLKAVTDPADD